VGSPLRSRHGAVNDAVVRRHHQNRLLPGSETARTACPVTAWGRPPDQSGGDSFSLRSRCRSRCDTAVPSHRSRHSSRHRVQHLHPGC
jgi:hypothetical protein